jgi:hypothetical protein
VGIEMNERIRELELLCYEECGDYHLGSIRQLNVEKFAELIVQECIEIIEPCRCGCRCEQEVAITDSIITDIKEHFGVTE